MTTLTFKEDLGLNDLDTPISVDEFLDILYKKGYFTVLNELDESEITDEIKKSYLLSKKSNNRVNI